MRNKPIPLSAVISQKRDSLPPRLLLFDVAEYMCGSDCSGAVEALILYFTTPSIVDLSTEGKLSPLVVHEDPLLHRFPCFYQFTFYSSISIPSVTPSRLFL
jgi:hypothetical protein